MMGLYVHIPFCRRRCAYCDFHSEAIHSGAPVQAWLDALDKELRRLPSTFVPDTVFLGGGTPTVLPPDILSGLMDRIRPVARAAIEWTVEANPESVDERKAALLRRAGVDRLSLGVQSFDPRALAFLGRAHTTEDTRRAWKILRAEGFERLGLDLIHGLPVLSDEAQARDVEEAIALEPEHVSCYALSYEPGTPLSLARDRGAFAVMEDERERAQYDRLCERLAEAGFEQYELSNFARPGGACRHNVNYWTGGAYIGIGPAAHSHWNGARWGNVADTQAYIERMRSGAEPFDRVERLEPEAKARESLVMGLRLTAGVSKTAFREQTGFDLDRLGGEALRGLVNDGWLTDEGGRVRLARHARYISNAVFAELV